MNSAMGILSTLLNIYTTQGGHWSVNAYITAGVTGTLLLVSGTLYLIYEKILLPPLKDIDEPRFTSVSA